MKRTLSLFCLVFLILSACAKTPETPAPIEEPKAQLQQQQPAPEPIPEPQPPTWEEQYDLGLRYLSEGKYEEAIIAFTAAIEIDPKRAPAFVGRGDAYSGTATLTQEADVILEMYQQAVDDYQAALELGDERVQEKLQAIQALLKKLQNRADELLQPLYVLFSQGDLDSAKALMRTETYQNMSASLTDDHYEYTENGSEFVAVYPGNYYYFGSMESGQRSGHGLWLSVIFDADSRLESQLYDGNWSGDFPNGEGMISRTHNMEQSSDRQSVYTEIQGSFKNGLYHGTIYETWQMGDGSIMEWSPITAVDGIFQPYTGERQGHESHQHGYIVAIAIDDPWNSELFDDGNIHSIPGLEY